MVQKQEDKNTAKPGSDATEPISDHRQQAADPAASLQVDDIEVDKVMVPEGHREVDETKVEALKEDIVSIGLTNPISVRQAPDDGTPTTLVAGRHRLEAFRRLGWQTIPAIVFDDDDLAAEQREITENLVRSSLTPAQEARATKRLKELYEAQHPETKHGGNRRSNGEIRHLKSGKSTTDRFTKKTAKVTGRSETAVKEAARRGKALGDEVLDDITGTDLDKGTELDALAKMPEPERKAKVAEAAAEAKKPASERKHVTAREPKTDADSKPHAGKLSQRLLRAFEAWKKCNRREREDLMKMIKKAEEAEQKKNRTTVAAS